MSERLLEEALAGAKGPREVIEALQGSEVLVPKPPPDGDPAESGLNLPLISTPDGGQAIPLFSSLERLAATATVETAYFRIPFVALAEDWPAGVAAVINPGDPHEFRFWPTKDGDGGSGRSVTVPADTPVFVGDPADEPIELLAALTRFFAGESEVAEAYRAQVFIEAPGEVPHLAVGLRFDDRGGDDSLLQRTAAISSEVTDEPMSFLLLDRNTASDDPVAEYMIEQTAPFYRRE